jgi:threonine synthase
MSASWLRCVACGSDLDGGTLAASCPACGGELAVEYSSPRPSTGDGPGIFRFAGRLPISSPGQAISLGEGGTPLISLNGTPGGGPGPGRLRVKCEHMNPTGSFKDRIAAVAATIMAERSITGCVGTSSGNGGAAMAAYAARGGRSFMVFVLTDTVPAKLLQIRAAGARVALLRGLGHDAAATEFAAGTIVRAALARGLLPFITAARFAPEPMEGAKTIAYELAEQAPGATAVYVPIGGGGLFSAIGRGYRELAGAAGAGGRPAAGPPRLVAVQPSGCATIAGLQAGRGTGLDRPVETTLSGLQVPVLFDARGVTAAIEWSGGHHVEVDDDDVFRHQERLARQEGIMLEPAGAAALAAVTADLRRGALGPDDDVIVIGTGAGYKDAAALDRIAGDAQPAVCGIDEIDGLLSTVGGDDDG